MAPITVEQYAAGVLGFALIRHWYEDGTINERRLQELREVLEASREFPWSLELHPTERDLEQGYGEWSQIYDGPNPLIEAEERIVRPMLSELAGAGVRVLDAACGTGRHAAFLESLGCHTVGVDRSRHMLTVARAKLPLTRFETASIEELPFDDDEFDHAVVSLALCHLADLTPPLEELARVVVAGGSIVVSDPHPTNGIVGGQAFYGAIVEGEPLPWVRNHHHTASTWLSAFRDANLRVRDCVEVPFSDEQIASFPASSLFPEAAIAALSGLPCLWVWQLDVDTP